MSTVTPTSEIKADAEMRARYEFSSDNLTATEARTKAARFAAHSNEFEAIYWSAYADEIDRLSKA